MNTAIKLALMGQSARYEVVTPPAAFLRAGLWMPTIAIGRTRGGRIVSPSFTIEDYLGPDIMGGVIVYCDPVSGNNSNSGLTTALPKLTLYAASRVTNARIIMIRGTDNVELPALCDMDGATLNASQGMYIVGCNSSWVPTKNAGVSIRITEVLDGSGDGWAGNAGWLAAWTADETADGTAYKAQSRAARTYRVYDLTNPDEVDGLAIALTAAANVAGCKSTANTFYHDTANSLLYVHTHDGRAPDAGLIVTTNVVEQLVFGNQVFGARNVRFEGGRRAIASPSSPTVAFCPMLEDCVIGYTYDNGVGLSGYGSAVFNRVTCDGTGRPNGQDGFSLDGTGITERAYALLVDCEALHCDGGENSQGLTGHGTNASFIVAVNMLVQGAGSQSVALTGSVSGWMLGVRSVSPGQHATGQDVDFYIAANMALERCTGNGATALNSAADGQFYLKNNTLSGAIDTTLDPIAY